MKSDLVPIGSRAPDFRLPDAFDAPHRLDDLVGEKLLIIFFRGFWCETCQAQLGQLRDDHQEFLDRGGYTVAISAETVDRSREGQAGAHLPFLILCDPDLAVIAQYGVLHRPDDQGAGIARPSVFLVDREGIVRFAHVGVEPRDRPAIGALLLALEAMD